MIFSFSFHYLKVFVLIRMFQQYNPEDITVSFLSFLLSRTAAMLRLTLAGRVLLIVAFFASPF